MCAAVDAIPLQKLLGSGINIRNAAMIRMGQNYFNSGVLLVNPKKWKEINSFENWKKIYANYQQLGFGHADQCLLNFMCFETFHHLDAKYNVFATIRKSYVRNSQIKILHFPGRDKPWTFETHSAAIFLSSVKVRFFFEYFKVQNEMVESVKSIDGALAIDLQNLHRSLLKNRPARYLLGKKLRKIARAKANTVLSILREI